MSGGNTQLFTVFSSSNYQGGGNKGAVLVFPGDGLANPDVITWQPGPGRDGESEEKFVYERGRVVVGW